MNNINYYHFFNNVMIYLNEYDWELNLISNSSEGYCWKNKKIINIGLNCKNIKQLILHEIAHINTCRFCNNKHNKTFWKTYEFLMKKILPKDSLEKRYNQNIECYKKIYE